MKLRKKLSLLCTVFVGLSLTGRSTVPFSIQVNRAEASNPSYQVRMKIAPFSLIKMGDVFFIPQKNELYSIPVKPNQKPVSAKGYLARAYDGCKEFYKNLLYYLHIRRDLKPVPENQKNLHMKALAARRDGYNAKADLNSFIEKLRITTDIVFKNETQSDVAVELTLESNGQKIVKKIHVKAGKFQIVAQDGTRLISVALVNSPFFLNPKWTVDSQLQITIEKEQDRGFLHQFHPFSFKSEPYTQAEIADANQSVEEREFKKQFNAHLVYVDTILARSEGLTLSQIDQQRAELFARNNIAKILERDSAALDRYETKIPLITHKIWVTSDKNPVSIPNYYLEWYENSIKHNPVSEGWKHILWIESKKKLPELAKKLENHPNITIMEIKDLQGSFVTKDLYQEAINKNQFGKATDILRLEILRQCGGFYLDTDYELFQSLKPLSKVYDLVVAVEPMSAFLCNAFIGATPDHPVINRGLEMIARNLNPNTAPAYITHAPDNGFKTIVETGPAMLTVAFAQAAGKIGNCDIALPPMLIYPTVENKYPLKEVVKPTQKMPAESIGAHYWETAWMRKEFGSKG